MDDSTRVEVIRNLLTVVKNKDNNPKAIKAAHQTLSDHYRDVPEVAIFFQREAEVEKHKALKARILALKKPKR